MTVEPKFSDALEDFLCRVLKATGLATKTAGRGVICYDPALEQSVNDLLLRARQLEARLPPAPESGR